MGKTGDPFFIHSFCCAVLGVSFVKINVQLFFKLFFFQVVIFL